MNDNDDMRSADKELQSYLDGGDGISAAYRQASGEQPSEALDAAILRSAHDADARPAVGPVSTGHWIKGVQLTGLVSLAASMVLGIMIGSMFLGDTGSNDNSLRAADSTVPDGTFVRRLVETRAPAEPVQLDLLRSESEEGPELLARDEPSRAVAGAGLRQRTVFAGDRLEAMEAATEEIVVTGSRIREENAPMPAYRDDQAEWLREMAVMSLERDNMDEQLREEMRLFQASHPQVDLDTALASTRAALAPERREETPTTDGDAPRGEDRE